MVGDAQTLSGTHIAPRTLVVANVVYTELLDALEACAPKRRARDAAPEVPHTSRARRMDLCACIECDDDDMGD